VQAEDPDSVAEFEQRYYSASRVFTPSSPIDSNDLFAGRKAQVTQLIDAINQPGQHAVLYGERGVGKTSLANVLHGFWQGHSSIIAPRINCLSTDTYSSVWERALTEIQTTGEARLAGFRDRSETVSSTLFADIGSGTLTHDRIRRVLTAVGREGVVLVIFFDEFDQLQPDVRKSMSETVKMLSDFIVPATLIFVGVADSVTDLLHDHKSVERALIQVCLRRMPDSELKTIVEKGVARLEMTVDSTALSRIARLSLGLPHYTHLISLHAVRESLDRHSLALDSKSVDSAIGKALAGAQQGLIDAYSTAVASSQRTHLYRQVLTACAKAKTDENGYFTPVAVREPLSRILGKSYDVPSYVRHLNEFSEGKRGRILHKIGSKRNFRFRFANPLMQPYVLMKAKHDGFDIYQ
jgi:energy-coupling factor transporter ATP-binding protein EcfA2